MNSTGLLGATAFVGSVALVVAASAATACSSTTRNSGFAVDDADGGSGGGTEGGASGGPGFGGGSTEAGGGCTGIGCDVVECGASPTTITGRVFDPAGKNPLYNVIVYVPSDPNAALPALSQGSSCDKCSASALNPVTSALTDENGNFTLTNVPVTKGVAVVVQVGKWRKKVTLDVTAKCAENKLPAMVTLPKNGSEGDMPQIAVTTGAFDSLECLVLGMGVDLAEFVQGDDPSGHVHLFKGTGGSTGVDAPSMLWNDATLLAKHDLVALSCEGNEYNNNKTNMQAMHDYINAGGRVFATHFHYTWFKNGPQADFKGIANWTSGDWNGNTSPLFVDQSFPKGKSFALWLQNVGASKTLGQLPVNEGDVQDDLSNVTTSVSQGWLQNDPNNVKYFSFNAPIGAKPEDQCGRAVYSDIHVSSIGGEKFPSKCIPAQGAALSPQQKALEFMLFDLSACVQSDSTPPAPPK